MAKKATNRNGETVGQQATRGFAWVLLQGIFSKVVGVIGQIILAWYLLPEDFGLVGLVYTIASFTALIQAAGIREVLVHRHRRFDRWATPAFWISLISGLLSGFLLAVLSPLAAIIYSEPRVVGLMLVLAAAAPLVSLASVPHAKMQSEMRFGLLARLAMFDNFAAMGLAVIFAASGFGAYSFVLPKPIVASMLLIAKWFTARPHIRPRLELRRWRFLLSDTLLMLAGSVVVAVTANGDYFILGAMFSASTVGIYFFSFTLSMQAVTLIAGQLSQILFPALSRLSGVEAQTQAFLKATRIMAFVGVPVAAFQIAVAGPVIRMVFAEHWEDAIPVIQILSIATAFRVVLASGGSLLKAQGRFKYRLMLFSIYSPIFILAVYLGALYGGVIGVAWSVTGYYVFLGFFHLWLIVRYGGAGLMDAWHVYVPPLLVASLSFGPAYFASVQIYNNWTSDFLQFICTCAIGMPMYLILSRLLMKNTFSELRIRLVAQISRSQ